jgi:hypothetical protein
MTSTPRHRVIVSPAPKRKGWRWEQVARNGMVGAASPKTYDTKANAKRAGQRQVDALNWGFNHWLPVGEKTSDTEAAVLVVRDA